MTPEERKEYNKNREPFTLPAGVFEKFGYLFGSAVGVTLAVIVVGMVLGGVGAVVTITYRWLLR